MKKKISSPLKIAFLFVFAQLLACHKLIDWKDVGHEHNPDCRIEKVTRPNISDTITSIFYYNAKGNPVRVTNAGYPPEQQFRYDHKDRLTDYLGVLENNAYTYWHHYQYDHKGRIILDTLNAFGFVENGKPIPNPHFKWMMTYQYDALDRVDKITTRDLVGGYLYSDTFAYNSEGNLIATGALVDGEILYGDRYTMHDDKVSFLRTNKIWMFLAKNYSRNNLARATAYNSSGLPLDFQLPRENNVHINFLTEFLMDWSKIEYRCK